MKDDTESAKTGNKKALIDSLIMILSAINTGMFMIVKLIHIASQQIGITSILLGNIGTGVFFSSISLTSNVYSFFNYFREKSLYKK